MPFSDESQNLRIELDIKNCRFSPAELEKMERALDPLREPVRDFPVSDLYVTVAYHPRSLDFHVRSSLVLPGRTLFTGDRDEDPLSAWSRCVRKLLNKVTAYKERLSAKPEKAKVREGTAQEVVPTREPDVETLDQAVRTGDYRSFREAMFVYEEPVQKRAGRWIERYPEFEIQLGAAFTIDDLVEEVFLNAFEWYDDRPRAVRLGEWLEQLIDPAVKTLLKDPDAEQENIDLVRTWRESADEQQRADED
jgi:ribosome-associated translation inhibitor RaiA